MFLILGASNGMAKMCQIKDCAMCNAGQEFLKEEENQNKKGLVPPVCNGTKVTSDKEKYSVQNLPVCTKGNSDQEEYSPQNPKMNSPGGPTGNLPGNPPGNLSLCTKLTSGPVCNGTKMTSDKEKYSVQNLPVCIKGNSDQEEYSAQNPKVNSPGSSPENFPGNLPLCTKLTSGQPHFSNSLARKDGITPLIMAAAMNHDLCVDLLLSAGVDPNEESKVGCLNLMLHNMYTELPCFDQSQMQKITFRCMMRLQQYLRMNFHILTSDFFFLAKKLFLTTEM